MIAWLNLLGNLLWVAGCALALAILSYSHWQANVERTRWRSRLGAPRYQVGLFMAGILFCTGLALVLTPLIEKVVWLILGGFCLAGLIQALRNKAESQ